MFTTTVLFAVLSILAHLNPAAATNEERSGSLSLLDGITGEQSDDFHPTSGNPYGFGWFHPGAFNDGDRCWQNDREGIIGSALCVLAEINIGSGSAEPFNGWFDKPYYGYGHRFGWYHPGPYLNGDRCYEDGRDGVVQDTLCISVDTNRGSGGGLLQGLNLGRRSLWGSDYWQEPRFSPGHNFGWFHDGAFAESDRCWSDGYYGSITDSLCVLAKLDLNLKRDDGLGGLDGLTGILSNGGLGKSSYTRGDRCYKNGSWGRWRSNDCSILDATAQVGQASGPFRDGDKCWRAGNWGRWSGNDCSLLDLDLDIIKRDLTSPFLFRDDPRFGRGVPCTKNGQEGVLRDAICIIAEVDLNLRKRDHEEDVSNGVTSSFEQASHDPYYDEDDEDVAEAEEGSDEAAYDENMEKRLLGQTPGNNKGNLLGKTLSNLADGIKTRNLLGGLGGLGGSSGGLSQMKQLQQLDALKQLGALNQFGGAGGARQPGAGRVGSDGPLGGVGGAGGLGGILGRDHGLGESRSRLEELMSSIALSSRSLPTSEIAARQLDAILEKLSTPEGAKLLGGGHHKRLHALESLTGQLGKVGGGRH